MWLQRGHLLPHACSPLSLSPLLVASSRQQGWAMPPCPPGTLPCAQPAPPPQAPPGPEAFGAVGKWVTSAVMDHAAVLAPGCLSCPQGWSGWDVPLLHGDQQRSWLGARPRPTARSTLISCRYARGFPGHPQGTTCVPAEPSCALRDEPKPHEAVVQEHIPPTGGQDSPAACTSRQRCSGFTSICSTVWVSAM